MARHGLLWMALVPAGLALAGCATSIGVHDETVLDALNFDSGKRVDVRFCVYLDEDVTVARARELLDTWNREEAERYRLYVKPVSFTVREREATTFPALRTSTLKLPLPEQCDRALWFIGRDTIDYLYGLTAVVLPLPEIFGYVDDETSTRGYVVAHTGSLGQVIAAPPEAGTVHEIYHLLGCRQHGNMRACYHRIRELKSTFSRLNSAGFYGSNAARGFYPAYGDHGRRILVNHPQVARVLDASGPGQDALSPASTR